MTRNLGRLTFLLAFAAALPLAVGQGGPAGQDKKEIRPLKTGEEAPARTVALKNIDGKSVTLDSLKGEKGTLVIFSCNHCPYVQQWDARMAEIGNSCKAKGIGVVFICANDPASAPDDAFEKLQEQAKTKKYAFAYAVDEESEVARAFGATKTPEVFLFDAKHKHAYHGAVDDNSEKPEEVKSHWLKDAVDAVANGKPVPVAETKVMGCTIKLRQAKSEKKAG